jgi:hypothetical protein
MFLFRLNIASRLAIEQTLVKQYIALARIAADNNYNMKRSQVARTAHMFRLLVGIIIMAFETKLLHLVISILSLLIDSSMTQEKVHCGRISMQWAITSV